MVLKECRVELKQEWRTRMCSEAGRGFWANVEFSPLWGLLLYSTDLFCFCFMCLLLQTIDVGDLYHKMFRIRGSWIQFIWSTCFFFFLFHLFVQINSEKISTVIWMVVFATATIYQLPYFNDFFCIWCINNGR